MFKRIELIKGSSISDETIEKIRKIVPKNSKVIVCLDSNHTKDHVLKELQLYNSLVNPGSYIVVFDTNTLKLSELGACDKMYINNSPKEAVEDFLKMNDDFEIDEQYNKLYVSYNLNGYLRRK
jgi:cephalosporin hydroxylase